MPHQPSTAIDATTPRIALSCFPPKSENCLGSDIGQQVPSASPDSARVQPCAADKRHYVNLNPAFSSAARHHIPAGRRASVDAVENPQPLRVSERHTGRWKAPEELLRPSLVRDLFPESIRLESSNAANL
jgi:hypothetical protein